jgi:hypothetical protein
MAATYVGKKLKDVSDSLAPFRPPTAPAEDIEEEKRKIVKGGGPSFLFMQVTVAMVALSLLCYVFLPVSYAQPLSFLMLSVAVAVGIFLWK